MVSTIALRRASSNSFISKLWNPAVVPSVCRCFTSDTQSANTVNVQRRSSLDRSVATSSPGSPFPSPAFLSDAGLIDPFPPKRTLSQIMDPFFNSLLGVGGSIGSSGFSSRQMWDMMGEEKGLHLKMAVPEQGKQDVKVNVGSDSSAIKGSGGKGSEDGDGGKKYSTVVARGVIGTALFPISLFVHINEGMEEIIADYVHHEMTRNYILVSMRLFLLIAAKDACVSLFF